MVGLGSQGVVDLVPLVGIKHVRVEAVTAGVLVVAVMVEGLQALQN